MNLAISVKFSNIVFGWHDSHWESFDFAVVKTVSLKRIETMVCS